MRKITMLNRISVDGYFAGPNGEIDWFIHDPEVDQAAHEMMNPDTLLLGRRTYEMFFGYWPEVAKDPDAPAGARATADELAQMNKVVFSKRLAEVAWENSKLHTGDVVETVAGLKSGEGADITIFGSGTIVQALSQAGMIDEYLVIVTPVILGAGKALFENTGLRRLALLATRRFDSGNVLVHYGAV